MRGAWLPTRAGVMCARAVTGLAVLLAVCWAASAQAQVSVATFNGLKAYTATVATRMLDLERRVLALEQSAPGGAAAGVPPELVGRIVTVEQQQARQDALWSEHQDYIRRLRPYLATVDYAIWTLLCRHRYDDSPAATNQGAAIQIEHAACFGTGMSPKLDAMP